MRGICQQLFSAQAAPQQKLGRASSNNRSGCVVVQCRRKERSGVQARCSQQYEADGRAAFSKWNDARLRCVRRERKGSVALEQRATVHANDSEQAREVERKCGVRRQVERKERSRQVYRGCDSLERESSGGAASGVCAEVERFTERG